MTMKQQMGVFHLDGDEGYPGNFHNVSLTLTLPVIGKKEDFLDPSFHPDYYGIIRQSEIPTLCGHSGCECGSRIHLETIPGWMAIPNGYLREESFMIGVEVENT